MAGSLVPRLLAPIVQVRSGETTTLLLMFAYSFLAMTAYNIIQPVTRSKFIADLGADNLPYVQFAAGLLIGVIMQLYSRVVGLLPRRWVVPLTQGGIAALLIAFWFLFRTHQAWVSVAFFLLGLILAILLISQFWTLANDIYDARQAKRVFGFIGGGSVLGGATGAGITALIADNIGTDNLVLCSATVLIGCIVPVWIVVRRERPEGRGSDAAKDEEAIGGKEALRLLRESKHLQLIAVIIGFGAMGAGIIDQQLNMATAEFKGRGATDAMTVFLAQVRLYVSLAGVVIQVWLTPRIHRYLGIGFAMMILPTNLGLTGAVVLLNAALWAPALARVLDSSIRYTVDKTTREVLFLPLPVDLKYKAKPFVDVTVDRFAKGLGAILTLVLIKPWGLGLTWQQLSYVSLTMTVVWFFMAMRAKRQYIAVFRRSIEQRDVLPAEVRLNVADLSTIETLIEELAHPDERRVLYAIDLLESLDKHNLITPLLLRHESEKVRVRALAALQLVRPEVAERWIPAIERMLKDESADVRVAAVKALAGIRQERVAELMRPFLEDRDPRVAVTAAVALADAASSSDVEAAEELLKRMAGDTRQAASGTRREVAMALAHITNARFRHLLIPLIYDADLDVAREAIHSAKRIGVAEALFVPPLVSLLRHRLLKPAAREVLVGYGEQILDVLGYFLRDRDEDVWVRRHIPGTLAQIPGQKSMELLVGTLGDPDGFLRYKAIAAIEKLRREHPELAFDRQPIEALALKEGLKYFNYLGLHYNLFSRAGGPGGPPPQKRGGGGGRTDSLLARALDEKVKRTVDRIYRLLGLIYPWKDVAAARWAIERGDARARSSASEYLDNLLSGALRKRLMPVLEELPLEEKVRRGNVFLRTRPRDEEDTLAQLVHDEDQVIAAVAIHYVEEHQVWSLADDLEHALAFRDAKDWYVFEAASWALAARRLQAERRRTLWHEPLPASELANRLLQIPLFDQVSVDELFRIAGGGRQVRHEGGRVLYQEGTPPDLLQFLIDGKVMVKDAAGERDLEAPVALAFEEVLEGSPMRATVRVVDGAICLALSSEEFLTLLSDNIVLAQGLFRMLVEPPRAARWRTVVRGTGAGVRHAGGGLQAIEKALLLRDVPLLARASADQLLEVAAIAHEVPLKAGVTLFSESDLAAIHAIVAGDVVIEVPDGRDAPPIVARASDTVGLYETLVGIPLGRRGQAARDGVALRIDREEFFDLLADHIDLLQGIFSALLRAEAPAVARQEA